jgi:NADH:ubiquinone oxidoreductase subunit 2 (subunit N)
LLITWQKIIPIFILSVLITKGKFLFIILGATFSCVLISQTGRVLIILAFSSIFNNRWIISCTRIRLHTLILFIVLYWSAVIFLTTEIFKKMRTTEINNNKKRLSLLLVVNLSGLPPSTGFLSKWIVSIKILKFEWFFTLLLIISLSIYNTFSYLRMSSVVIIVFKNWPRLKPIMRLKGITFLSLYLLPFLI